MSALMDEGVAKAVTYYVAQSVPVPDILEQVIPTIKGIANEDVQYTLLDSVLGSQVLNDYPPAQSYVQDFLKRLVNTVEERIHQEQGEGALNDSVAAIAATLSGVPMSALQSFIPTHWKPLLEVAAKELPKNRREAEYGYVTFPTRRCQCEDKEKPQTKEELAKSIVNNRPCNYSEDDPEEFCYVPSKHMEPLYRIVREVDPVKITIKESKNLSEIAQRVWEGAYFLAHFASCCRSVFQGETAIELGCGTGLTGIALAAVTDVELLYLTDFKEVMPSLNHNINLNPDAKRKCMARELEWGSCSEEIRDYVDGQQGIKYGSLTPQTRMALEASLFFGSDLLYSPDTAYHLGRFVGERFRAAQHDLGIPKPLFLIAYTVRRLDTFEAFSNEVKKFNLEAADVTVDALRWTSCCDSGIVRTGFDSLTRQGKFKLRLITIIEKQ